MEYRHVCDIVVLISAKKIDGNFYCIFPVNKCLCIEFNSTIFLGQRRRKVARGHCLILHTCRRWLLLCSTSFSLISKEEEIHPVSTGNRRSSSLPQFNIERQETMARRNSNLDNLLSSSAVNQSVDGCTFCFFSPPLRNISGKRRVTMKNDAFLSVTGDQVVKLCARQWRSSICWESLWLVHHRKSRHMPSVHQSWWLNCRIQ